MPANEQEMQAAEAYLVNPGDRVIDAAGMVLEIPPLPAGAFGWIVFGECITSSPPVAAAADPGN